MTTHYSLASAVQKWVLLPLLVAAFMLVPLAPPSDATPKGAIAGIVSLWSGDRDSFDSVDGNHGSLAGDVTFVKGIRRRAFDFNGVDGHVRVPSSVNLNPTGSFSITGWILPTSDGPAAIIHKWGDTADWYDQRSYGLWMDPGGVLGFGISDSAHQWDEGFHRFLSPTGSLVLHRWNHVTAVYDQSIGTRRLYANGVLVAQRTDAPITILAGSADLVIGGVLRSPTSFAFPFTGSIDEVGFYSRALTGSEITKLAHR